MDIRKTKLALSAGALALSLALAGCGGGGSSSSAVTPAGGDSTPPPQTPPPQTVTVPSAVQSGADYADYAPDAGTITIPAGESRTSNGVMFKCGDNDCTVTVAADGMVTATGGMVTAGLTQAVMDLMDQDSDMATRAMQRSAANMAIAAAQAAANGVNNASTDDEVSAADQAIGAARQAVSGATALTAGERAELMALVTAASNTLGTAKTNRMAAIDDTKRANAGFGELLFAGMDNAPILDVTESEMTVTDKHGGAAAIKETTAETSFLTYTGTGNADAATPVTAVKATAMVPSLGAWKGTQLASAGNAPSSIANVYTDVAANTSKAFDENYKGRLPDGSSALVVDADESSDADVPHIMADAFEHQGRMDHAPDADAGDDEVIVRIAGTLQGARGQYQCTAAAAGQCVSHEDDNGVRLTVAGQAKWEFVPDPGAMVSIADGTYMYFGWWLHQDLTSVPSKFEVAAFHGVTGSPTDIQEESFNALSGKATYKGAAAGWYALDPILPGQYASGGAWTADAMLTADFGTEADGAGTIEGTVDKFMAGGEMMDWTVSLGETSLVAPSGGVVAFDSNANNASDIAGDDVVWTISDKKSPEAGSWMGNLRDQGKNDEPQAVTGEFNAIYSEGGHNIGRMVGAFGAHNEDPPSN